MAQNSSDTRCVSMTQRTLTPGQTTVECQIKMIPAIILHPSLGTPLVVEPGKPVSLLIVTDKIFLDEFLNSNGKNDSKFAQGGSSVNDQILQHLKILEWAEATALKKNLDKADRISLKKIVSKENIRTTYLGELEDKVVNAEGLHFANVRSSFKDELINFREDGSDVSWWQRFFSNDGVRHLFQIDLVEAQLNPGTMYDCFWVLSNLNSQKGDAQEKYLDIQDRIARNYLQARYYQYSGGEAPGYAFKVGNDGIDFTQFDYDTPIQNRHPIYITNGHDKLNFGHLSDIHVSSKQHTYKGKKATVIPGIDEVISPCIGDISNNNLDNFIDILNQFGRNESNVDAVIITGDLYDHMHNFDPAKLTSDQTGKLWEAMYLEDTDDVESRNDNFPCGIDGLAVYSILCYFYKTYEKPVFISSGNHEAYEYPYGISPRIPLKGKVNEGIPLDHNLTIYEAILLYGPGYKTVLKSLNFNKKNFDYFYNIFTPLLDCWQRVGSQCLIMLAWGDGEDFLKSAASGGGALPRTTKSITSDQKSLVETALKNDCLEKVMCSHFTLINYSLDHALEEIGEISPTSYIGDFHHGSVETGNKILHGDWLANNVFSLTLSGHSHRVGLYQATYMPAYEPFAAQAQTSAYAKIGSAASTANRPAYLRTKGFHPVVDKKSIQAKNWDNKTKVLVSASTGPIPKQNLKGEMSGQGMEKPSGSIVLNDGQISLATSSLNTAKPRFCVACDYIDIMADGFWEYFRASGDGGIFEMKIFWGKVFPGLTIHQKKEILNQEKGADLSLYLVSDISERIQASEVKVVGDGVRMKFRNMDRILFRPNRSSEIAAIFLSIVFNGNAFSSIPGFTDYEFSSPWNVQVEIYNKAYEDGVQNLGYEVGIDAGFGGEILLQQKIDQLNKRKNLHRIEDYSIRRHKRFGEVPDHKDRSKNWPSEYSYNLNRDF